MEFRAETMKEKKSSEQVRLEAWRRSQTAAS